MKRFAALLSVFLLPALVQAQSTPVTSETLDATVERSWKLDAAPVDVVHTLDNKRVFILTDDHKVRVFMADGQALGSIPVGEGVNAIDIEPRGEKLYLIDKVEKSFTAMDVSFVASIDQGNSPFKGNPNAPVTIVIFSDFQCPYCKSARTLIDQVAAANKDTLKIVFKNLPLRMHELAEPAAKAALAANAQGKFWEMHDALFDEPNLSMIKLIELAQKIGLDMVQFNKDMQGEAIRKQLDMDMQAAQDADVSATPTLFINGRKIKDRSVEAIQSMINQQLKK
ncbi:MAG: thioredoxin domain-containing protein [Desulfobulbaceae bacterium]|nr:thioredoxin domain-containing protein [Desulfobulbaceae bacterium]